MARLERISLALLLSSATFAVAAKNPQTILPDNVLLCQPSSGCFPRNLFGHTYRVLSTPRFTVMVSISDDGLYTRADVSVANNSEVPVNLLPDDFRVEVVSPKPKVLAYVAPADLIGVSPSPAIPAVPNQENAQTVSSTPRLLFVSTTPALSIDEVYSEVRRRQSLGEVYDRAVTEQHLTAVTIEPNQAVRGRVYFERDKHSRTINVVVPIAGLVFEFPYQALHADSKHLF